ncbi:hypothetical protein QJS10_CPA10g01617 [Acorus calamus]|uniref:Uncharacterized protein n=1 Tax=Acorus calamus TaxID=4465 RepID=A0AAV9DW96_ACOCL|nr:hypothetical protein QJS10_CPA10g01617 [Acorus calamus]
MECGVHSSSTPLVRLHTLGKVCLEGRVKTHKVAVEDQVQQSTQKKKTASGSFVISHINHGGQLSIWVPRGSWINDSSLDHPMKSIYDILYSNLNGLGPMSGMSYGPGSEPSIHGSLGPGSWANYYDEEGILRWQWCSYNEDR